MVINGWTFDSWPGAHHLWHRQGGTLIQRRFIGKLVSSSGLIVALVLLGVGGLLVWGHVFIDNQVHDQIKTA
jgi:hypothetical protein